MSVQEIERAIIELPKEEIPRLMDWMADYHHRVWDKQIEDDLDSGRLDGLLAEVEAEYQAGLARFSLESVFKGC